MNDNNANNPAAPAPDAGAAPMGGNAGMTTPPAGGDSGMTPPAAGSAMPGAESPADAPGGIPSGDQPAGGAAPAPMGGGDTNPTPVVGTPDAGAPDANEQPGS